MSDLPPVKTILILSANPKGTTQLRLDEEVREIKEGLRRAKRRKQFIMESAEAVRYRDIRRAILDFEPQILHFSGHGAGEEGLVFEDETGHEKLVDAEALAELFELFSDQLECVVLNACYSEVQAKAIAMALSTFPLRLASDRFPVVGYMAARSTDRSSGGQESLKNCAATFGS